MSVEHSTDRTGTDPGGQHDDPSRRAGGSHRAPRRGPSGLLVAAGVVLVAIVAVVLFLLLSGDDDDDGAAAAASDTAAASEAPSAVTADSTSDQASAAPEPLATAEGSVSAGQSLARNPRVQVGATERAELEEGRVDIRVLSLLALLGADYELGVADFAAPQNPGGERTAYVVDIDSVDGGPVDSEVGRELARVAGDQLGVYQPEDVSVQDEVLRITFAPRETDDLPPVPLP